MIHPLLVEHLGSQTVPKLGAEGQKELRRSSGGHGAPGPS